MTTKKVLKQLVLGGIKVGLFEVIFGPYHRVKLIEQLSVIDTVNAQGTYLIEGDLSHFSTIDVMRHICRTQGPLDLYKGSLWRVLFLFPAKGLHTFFKFHTKQIIIPYLTPYINQNAKKEFWRELTSDFIADVFAKFLSLTLLYPLEVCYVSQARKPHHVSSSNPIEFLRFVWAERELSGLYAGFGVFLLFHFSKIICKTSFLISSYYLFNSNPYEKEPFEDVTQVQPVDLQPTAFSKDQSKYRRRWKSLIINQLVNSVINFICYPLDTFHKVQIFYPDDDVFDVATRLSKVSSLSLFRGSLINTVQLNLRFLLRLAIELFKHR